MRILAGKFKGRLLTPPKGKTTRPTTSLVRKAVFDIARPLIQEASFLDLFAGTGAMGIEAISRGAARATFVEKDPTALHSISKNLKTLGIEKGTAQLLKGDALAQLKRLAKADKQFDIIYIDPPYELAPALIPEILKLLDTLHLLEQDSLLFIEEGSHYTLPLATLSFSHLHLKESRRYGMTMLHLFQLKE